MNRIFDNNCTTFPTNLNELESLERSITASYFALFDLINRLKRIRNHKLYYPAYPTFEEYLEEKWGMCRDSFHIQCKVVDVVDDLLEAQVPIDAFPSLPIITEYYNLDKRERWDLARRVLSKIGTGKVDKALTHQCKRELFLDKCEDPDLKDSRTHL